MTNEGPSVALTPVEEGEAEALKGALDRLTDSLKTMWAWDLRVGLIVGAGMGVAAALSASVRANGFTALLGIGGADVAVLGVALVAVQLFVTLLDPEYQLILSYAGGLKSAIRPYLVVAGVAGVAAAIALVGAITWSLAPAVWAGVILGVASWFCIWAVLGTVHLVSVSIFHVGQRSELAVTVAKTRGRRNTA